MKVLSINIGIPRDIKWKGKTSLSGIYKHPVKSRVYVSSTNIEGDSQGNLKYHGGKDKALYAYPGEHYEYW